MDVGHHMPADLTRFLHPKRGGIRIKLPDSPAGLPGSPACEAGVSELRSMLVPVTGVSWQLVALAVWEAVRNNGVYLSIL